MQLVLSANGDSTNSLNDSQVLIVKDKVAGTAWFVPELDVKCAVCNLSVVKYLMLSSEKQVKCVTVWVVCVCYAVLCCCSVSAVLSDKPFSAVHFMHDAFHGTTHDVFHCTIHDVFHCTTHDVFHCTVHDMFHGTIKIVFCVFLL
jgi:hypothetical protein